MVGEDTHSIFTIRLTGNGVEPSRVSAGDLAQLLIAAEKIVMSVARQSDQDAPDDMFISLADLQAGSLRMPFTSNQPERTGAAFKQAIANISNKRFEDLPGPALEGLRTLTSYTAEREGVTEFWNGSTAEPLLRLYPDFVAQIPRPQYYRGETTLYGKVERLGGVRPRVKLRVSGNQVVYGDITEEQGRLLGLEIFEHVGLAGNATWDARTGEVVYFRVTDILPYKPVSAQEAIAELRAATRGTYDKIEDVDLFAFQVREGDLP